ncbi:ATP synthase E chain-domain-containing protein [Papiliotrema laurentii]|uniref:ATP synthase F(0) complex subunit e, mitochondrial n=1 Tax=Papiliotrema laurentii TaxID=5418 RepID=A0AAD9CZQ0_PAPLA|nr:ATP synthase E chain-domain-containing protein [Papiliotrema laurentii]
MASATRNVVRWTALIAGVGYGIVHQTTLQTKYDAEKLHRHQAHRAQLVEKAREAYAAKKLAEKSGASSLVTDPEDPRFDLEKLIEAWTKSS